MFESSSYLLSDITDINESFTLQVLGELLMGGPSSPFYKTLVQPGIGAGFSPVSGYDSHIKETTFTVGLQNIDAKGARQKSYWHIVKGVNPHFLNVANRLFRDLGGGVVS